MFPNKAIVKTRSMAQIRASTRFLSRSAVKAWLAALSAMGGGCSSQEPSDQPTVCDGRGVICTVAGTGQSLFDGDGKLALQTSFYYPLDIAFDENGTPLILDFNNFRVRRITHDDKIATFMGRGEEDYPEEGALASETALHHASDIAMDSEGRLYVAGGHAPVVFLVDADDRVRIVAGNGDFGSDGDGGLALNARFMTPYGVVPDNAGGFYVSDSDAHVVRYIDAEGTIATVAGNGTAGYSGDDGPGPQAQLNNPTRMALDAAGRLHVCDTYNHAIRVVETDGTIRTLAGTGEPGYTGDGGVGSAAMLNTPFDLRFAPNGDLYVADRENHVIRRIDSDGIITTVVGTGTPGFTGDEGDAETCQLNRPSGVNLASDGSLWIADTYNQRIRRVSGFLATGPSGPH